MTSCPSSSIWPLSALIRPGDHVERGGLARTIRPQQADRLTAADIEADAIDHPASAVALLEIMRGQVALRALLSARGGILAWTRLGWRCLGDGSTGRRNRPAQGGQIHALRAAVGFSCPSRRAAVSKQREDVEHASALEGPGVQLRRPVSARNTADWNGSDRLVNPLPRWGLRACRSRTCASRRWPHSVGSWRATPRTDLIRRCILRRSQSADQTRFISSRERCAGRKVCFGDRIETSPRPGPGPSWTRQW